MKIKWKKDMKDTEEVRIIENIGELPSIIENEIGKYVTTTGNSPNIIIIDDKLLSIFKSSLPPYLFKDFCDEEDKPMHKNIPYGALEIDENFLNRQRVEMKKLPQKEIWSSPFAKEPLEFIRQKDSSSITVGHILK